MTQAVSSPVAQGQRLRAVMVDVIREKGYGFAVTSDRKKVFVHHASFRDARKVAFNGGEILGNAARIPIQRGTTIEFVMAPPRPGTKWPEAWDIVVVEQGDL